MGDFSEDFNNHNNLYYSVNGDIQSLRELTSINIKVSEED